MMNSLSFPSKTSAPLRVLGAGLSCLDIIQKEKGTLYYSGGSCGNVISALSFLGWESHLIVRKWSDAAGKLLESNIDNTGVKRVEVGGKKSAKTPRIIENLYIKQRQYLSHEFLLTCPYCNQKLPKFKPLSHNDIAQVLKSDNEYNVFYTDRCSPGIKSLREKFINKGSWSVFESNSSRNLQSFLDNSLKSSIVKFSAEKVSFSIAERLKELAEKSRILLIIQTIGKKGLRFCYRKKDKCISPWINLAAQPVSNIIDTTGAGDWCTTGMLTALVTAHKSRPDYVTKDEAINALQYGQAFSAISCSFIGGQGLLYAQKKEHIPPNQLIQGVKIPELKSIEPAKVTNKNFVPSCQLCLQEI